MLTFSKVMILLYTFGMSCQSDPTLYADTLPASSQIKEDWLNTSRQIRYALNAEHSWQGWILHPLDSAVAVHILHFTHQPSSKEWLTCVRTYCKIHDTSHIWLSSTPENIALTYTYASRLGTNLSIQKSDC